VSSINYRSFVIRVGNIEPENATYALRVESGTPGGQPGFNEQETCRFDPADFVIDSGGIPVNLIEQLKSRDITHPQLFKLGAILSDMILPGTIRRRLLESLKIVRARKQGLRIRLNIEARELIPLPWEYLYLEGVGTPGQSELNFLALQPDISIVRHEAIDLPEPSEVRRDHYKLVAALADPTKPPQLNVEKDRQAIKRMIETVDEQQGIGTIEPVWVDKATPDKLFDALRAGADIFHFAGHGYFNGESGQIVLHNNENGNAVYYDAASLALLLTKKVSLAVLGACESAQTSGENIWGGVAQALVQAGVAAVVASQLRLADTNAEPLAEEVYRGVLAGGTVDEAVSNARRAIHGKSGLVNRDWGALVLYLRVEDGVIFPRQAISSESHTIVPHIAPTPLQATLIGRDEEIRRVQSELRGGKYYFYGAYGVGKTSLATELFTAAVAKDDFTDGYIWHQVAQKADVSSVLEWIGAQFGEQSVALAAGPEAKVNALRELLASRDDLLIGLDEVYDAKVARAVLAAAGKCTVVLNGPKLLGLSNQIKEFALSPLVAAEAVRLFAALIHRPLEEIPEGDRQRIESICEKMGYLPLAINLAALKHAEGESLSTIQARLEVAPTTIIEGHEEVSTIFAAIYDDLQKVPAALRLLVHLASFPALEASLEPLRSGEDDLEFFQAKDKLVALGLVSAAGTDRLSLHPLLGRLAHDRADKETVTDGRKRVTEWLLNYAHEHTNDYSALEREHRNLLGLLDRFKSEKKSAGTISLIRDIFDYLRVRGYWREAHERLNQALKSAQELQRPSDEAWVYLHIGIMLTQQGDYKLAQENYERADALYSGEKNQSGRGQVLYRRSNVSFLQSKLSRSLQQARKSLTWMDESAPARDRAGAHARVASILATQGNLDEAREQYYQALNISSAAGDLEEQARVHASLGRLLRKAGKHNDALEQYQLAHDKYERIGHVRDRAMLELEIGYQHYYRGDYDEATKHFLSGRATFEVLKYKLGLALAYHALGNVAYSTAVSDDLLAAAEREYQRALKINRDELQADLGAARNQYQLAVIAQRRGHNDEARSAYEEVEKVARREKDLALLAGTLHQLGRLDLAQGNLKRAVSRAKQALKFAEEAEDRLTQVSALSLFGLVEARLGHLAEAQEKLAAAQAAFNDLNAPEADKVERLLQELKSQLDSSEDSQYTIPHSEEPQTSIDVLQEGVVADPAVDVTVEGYAPGTDSSEESPDSSPEGVDVMIESPIDYPQGGSGGGGGW